MKRIPAPDTAALQEGLRSRYAEREGFSLKSACGELTLRVPVAEYVATMAELRDDAAFSFDQLVDLCGIDYSEYGSGHSSLFTKDAMRSDERVPHDQLTVSRFAVVCHLLSTELNHRLRVRVFLESGKVTLCPTLTGTWQCADWYEREAFDLYGIVFEGHPDLRRLLTDYGFIGHPFRKDFPVYGKVEMRYDPDKGRVVYQPVTIDPREVVPKIRRRHES